MNYWERHIGDYARDAGHLSMLEHGAYTLLLDRYYSTEQPIPADQAHRICRARSKDERAAVDAVLAEFFTLQDGNWINGRAAREVEKAQAKINAARTNGAKGGRPRGPEKQTQQKPTGLSPGSDSETQAKAHQTPDTKHQTPEKTRESARGTRLAPDWSPPAEHMAFAESLGLRNGKAAAELAKFRDYWVAQPGAKGVKTDWPATWRNWCRRASENVGKAGASSAQDAIFDGVH